MRERKRVFSAALLFVLSACAAEGNPPRTQDHMVEVERQTKQLESLEALALLESELIGKGNDDYRTLNSSNALGALYVQQDKYDLAEPLLAEAWTGFQEMFGNKHPKTKGARENLEFVREALENPGPQSLVAIRLHEEGKLEKAAEFYRKALEGFRRAGGPDLPDTLYASFNLARCMESQGKDDEAEGFYRESLEGARRVLGPEDRFIWSSLANLGLLYKRQSKFAEAEPLFRELLVICRDTLSPDHQNTLNTIYDLRFLLKEQGKFADAEKFAEEAVKICEWTLGPKHADTLHAKQELEDIREKQRETKPEK